ncbi:hypothetical protein DE146DRAFT_781627 [Phaeosphaeria sp. MPI-PUGE-AT-0046c]|nr:hypothetical protein DE146DRAFT_781627 [Phaeosphaeria sp. MPI-PUGE-AT-0046c]
MLILVLFCLAGLASIALGQDQIQDFCRRFEHRTAIVNNKLYIDGGKWQTPLKLSDNITNTDLLYSDLLVINEYLPSIHYAPSKQHQVPAVSGGTLWADEINSRFYAFGGYHSDGAPPAFKTWTYDTSQNKWETVDTLGDTASYVAHGMSAIAPDSGRAFYLGGYHDSTTDVGWTASKRYTTNLVEFDMVSRQYTNRSGPDNYGRGEGLMVFVPASNTGLLIYFGGVVQTATVANTALASMDSIWIYDISLHKWYQQRATGDIPESRSRFCGTVAWPDDKSSFNIYFYGGLAQNGSAFEDLYLLSIPSFTWVKLYSGVPDHGHHSLTCDIVNGTQMIVMGGDFPDTDDCDAPPVLGQHNVDMGSIITPGQLWNVFNSNNPPYRVPGVLVDIIGGTVRGGANATGPKSNRTYDQYLFEKKYNVPQRYPTPVNAASTTASVVALSGTDGLSRGTLIGAIIGSIVGGVLVGLGVFYLIHHLRRRARDQEPIAENVGQAENHEEKILSDEVGPGELLGHSVNEVGNVRANEMESRSPAEMWAEPAELAGPAMLVRNGDVNDAQGAAVLRPET